MTPRELLLSGSQELGVDLTVEQVNSIFLFLAELRKWNRRINLTAIREERDVVIKHVLDSLSFLKGFGSAQGVRLLDMGSGAGFPALLLKIARPGLSVTLVESVKKKASFLRHAIRTLHLTDVDVIDRRTEELADRLRTSFDIVTARAFADMRTALVAGEPFLSANGRIVLSRGPEEKVSEQELTGIGLSIENKVSLTLPHSEYRRVVWIFRRS